MTEERTAADYEAKLEELAEAFEFLDDWEDRYEMLIELGDELQPMPGALKTDATKVKGCLSQVWVYGSREGETMRYVADSDAHIVRGLVALVMMMFDARSAEAVANVDAKAWLTRLGLDQHLSPGRSNGLHSMIQRVQAIAAG